MRHLELVEELTKGRGGTTQAAINYGVTPQTVRKWLGRFLAGGEAALADASSRPYRSPAPSMRPRHYSSSSNVGSPDIWDDSTEDTYGYDKLLGLLA